MAKATESICPKGWTLPSETQIRSIGNGTATYVPAFSPVLGGIYHNSGVGSPTHGRWFGSEAFNTASRRYLDYDTDNLLHTYNLGLRHDGLYVRCVAKQKTITDLAYMQDVTDEV